MNLSKCVRVVLSCLCVLPFTTEASWHECCCPNFDYSYNPPLLEPAPCGKFFVEGEAFVWRAHVDNLTPGWVDVLTYDEASTVFNPALLKANERDLSYDWDWGFRVGVGFDAACDHWGARLQYTYFYSNSDDHVRLVNGDNLPVTGFTNFFFELPTEAILISQGEALGFDLITVDSNYKVELHQVDLDISREYFVGCFLSIRPVLGLRYFCLDQKFNVLENDLFTNDDTSPEGIGFTSSTHAKVRYEGVGIKFGFNTNWELACGFGIFGDAFLTTAYGDYHIKNNTDIGFVVDDTNIVLADLRNGCANHDFCALKPIIDYSIGLYWRKGFNCDKSLFEVRVAWENHIWFFQNQFRGVRLGQTGFNDAVFLTPRTETRPGDVTFAGFSLMAGIWF